MCHGISIACILHCVPLATWSCCIGNECARVCLCVCEHGMWRADKWWMSRKWGVRQRGNANVWHQQQVTKSHLQNKALSYYVVHTRSTCTLNCIQYTNIYYMCENIRFVHNCNKLKEPEKLGEKSTCQWISVCLCVHTFVCVCAWWGGVVGCRFRCGDSSSHWITQRFDFKLRCIHLTAASAGKCAHTEKRHAYAETHIHTHTGTHTHTEKFMHTHHSQMKKYTHRHLSTV